MMAYPTGNGSFFNVTYQEDQDYDDNENNNYESDDKGKAGRKPPRKSTKGRKLKRWDADEDQKLLLYIDYVCNKQGLVLPWDDIAATMEPRNPAFGEWPMTGEAIKQHLSKLREHRDKDRDDAPPKLDRNARRIAAAGKNIPQTPLPTPKKFGGNGGQFGTGKVEIEGPVKRESTLLAPMSKVKRKRAEQSKRVLGLGTASADSGRVASATGNVVKGVTGKRTRRPAIVDEDEYRDNTGTAGSVNTKQLRQPKPKDYSGLTLGSEDNIKNEPDSEDDLPLSKRRNLSRKSGAGKQRAPGLMDNTYTIWKNRDATTATGQTTVQSAGIERPKEQFITVPNAKDHDQQNELGLHQVPKTAPCDAISNRFGFPFGTKFSFGPHYPSKEHQEPGSYGQAAQQCNAGDNFGNPWSHLQSGHPSPMDNSFMGPHTSFYPGTVSYGSDPVGPLTPYTPSTHGNLTDQAVGFAPCNSSPSYGSFSSHTLPSTNFDPSLGPNVFDPLSRTTSWSSSAATAHDLQDPFIGNNDNGAIAGLPAVMPNMNTSNFEAAAYTTTTLASLGTNHHNLDDFSGQSLPDLAEPSMPAAGLGISIPPSGENVSDPAPMASADDAVLKCELPSFLTQSPTPMMASGLDHAYPQDLFGAYLDVNGHANLSHSLDNDLFG